MKRIILLFILTAGLTWNAKAQPPKRKTPTTTATRNNAQPNTTVSRAALMFPTAAPMPEDAAWRRDIYRQLDLKKDKNAVLYYPVEPIGKQSNLFTSIFRLLLDRKIQAYSYRLDGNESFNEADKMKVKDFLDRYHIYYETANGRYQVDNSDIPSAEVTRYYVKESTYYDQHTATLHTQVTALCPVMMRADDFLGEGSAYPLFWVKYDDLRPYLAQFQVMGSNLNNASTMSADDYFTLNCYDGDIYKTNNLQGRIIANYCPTDSDRVKEQKRIETQLVDFEKGIWHEATPADTAKTDVQEKATKSTRNRPSARKSRSTASSSSSSKSKSSASTSKNKTPKSSGSSSARVSVRRQRH